MITVTNTGVAPACTIAAALAAKVIEGTITSSPGPMPREINAKCNATVPLETATEDLFA